jgi:putative holliday junction resolvase
MDPLPPPPDQSNRPILALDIGLHRTGLARSDPGRSVAFGLPTFENRNGHSLKRRILSLHGETPLGGVVLGLPLHMDGRPGDLVARVYRLGEWIARELSLPVAYRDERLTSEEAGELLRQAPHRVRQEKGARDRLAAQVILREFLAAGCPFPTEEALTRLAPSGEDSRGVE